jgi:hypothetical protein
VDKYKDKDIYREKEGAGGKRGKTGFRLTPRTCNITGQLATLTTNITGQLATLTTNITGMLIVTAAMLVVPPAEC